MLSQFSVSILETSTPEVVVAHLESAQLPSATPPTLLAIRSGSEQGRSCATTCVLISFLGLLDFIVKRDISVNYF